MQHMILSIGVLGMGLVLWAFLMLQQHRWSQDDLIYDVVSFIGAGLLVIYAVIGKAWPFVVLNSLFALYSLKDIFSDLKSSKSALLGYKKKSR